jgi:aminopeptidase N
MTNYHLFEDKFEYSPTKYMPITNYTYPEKFTPARQTQMEATKDMLRVFSEKFGEYPFIKEKYGHAEFSWGGGMEHQTITSLINFNEDLVAHELAHQWFGDKVTCQDWQHIWLNEGFATYSESIYFEAKYGKQAFMNDVTANMNSAKNAKGSIYVQNISSIGEIFNSSRSYAKGSIVLHMLRGIVGDDKFFQILKEYLTEPGLSYNVATTEDFQRVAERVSGMDLNYFFKEWIYGENYPKYTVGKNIKQLADGSYQLTFRLKQDINTNPSFFTMPVRLQITSLDVRTNTTLFNNEQDQSWVIPLGKTFPSSIEFDPDNWILKDIVANTSVDKNQEVPTTFSLSQNYPNPFNPSTIISYQLSVDSYVTLKVYDLLGREVETLVNEFRQPGYYNSQFSILNQPAGRQGSQLFSGVYFYRLTAGNLTQTKKMVLIK